MSGIVGTNAGRASGVVGTVDSSVGADAIDGSNIADDSIDSEHYVDGSIDTAHLAADVITGAKIADDAIDSEHYTDVSIDAAHIASNAVTTAKINADAVTGAKIADDAIDSEHYAAGSIDTAHIADNQITLAKMAGGTDGNIISYDASGDPVAIATGSDGQVLTSTGAGSPPAFEAIPGGGKVLQVLSTNKTDTYTNSSGAWADVTGLSQAITPSASSSKILVILGMFVGNGGSNELTFSRLMRGSTAIAIGDASGSRTRLSAESGETTDYTSKTVSVTYLDSPSTTSATTYKAQIWDFGNTAYVNRVGNNSNQARFFTGFSSITCIEIGA